MRELPAICNSIFRHDGRSEVGRQTANSAVELIKEPLSKKFRQTFRFISRQGHEIGNTTGQRRRASTPTMGMSSVRGRLTK